MSGIPSGWGRQEPGWLWFPLLSRGLWWDAEAPLALWGADSWFKYWIGVSWSEVGEGVLLAVQPQAFSGPDTVKLPDTSFGTYLVPGHWVYL